MSTVTNNLGANTSSLLPAAVQGGELRDAEAVAAWDAARV